MFDTTANLLRVAQNRRRDAINAHPRLMWVVRLLDDAGHPMELKFETSPDFARIARRARDMGVHGQVHLIGVNVQTVRPRPLLLGPCLLVKNSR